jgi:hypothetical protein
VNKESKKELIISILIVIIGILSLAYLIISAIRDYYLHGFMYVLKHDIIIFLMGICSARIIRLLMKNNDEN